MKKEYIILIIVAIVALFVANKYKSKIKNTVLTIKNKAMQIYSDAVLQKSFDELKKQFSDEILKNVEKMFRLETAHFTSGGLKLTNHAGMQGTKSTYPYGWNSLKTFWDANPNYAPMYLLNLKENKQPDVIGSGIVQKFMVFKDIKAGLATLAEFLRQHENNAGRWFSLKPDAQKKYNEKIKLIKSRYV